jgi:putative ABC transport system permease protein
MRLNFIHAVRHLRRRPVLTAAGIVSLAVGIGCALACAGVVNSVMFRALPYHDPGRLVLVWENNSKRGVGLTPTSVLNYEDLRASATTFDALGAFVDEVVSLDGPDGSTRVTAYRTTAGLLAETQVPPLLGRLFTADDDRAGSTDVAVLSHGLWQQRFGGDPAIVGRVIRVTDTPYTVVGVMPKGFLLPPIFGARLIGTDVSVKEADLWVPIKLEEMPRRRDARMLFMLGRLKAGSSAEENQAEASTIAQRLAADYPVDDLGLDFAVVPLQTQVLANVRTLLLLLSFVGALVLIIAGINAAHLLLADSLTMTGETAVRSALGASAWRLASTQGTLSALWCSLATAGALLVAAVIETPVAAYTKANVPRLNDLRLDGTAAMFALAVGVGLALAISLLPIAYAKKAGSARSATATAAPTGIARWRQLFVVVQLAVAVIVLSTAALLFRSADALSRVNPGFVAEGVSAFDLMLPDSRYGTAERRVQFEQRLLESTADVPGGRSVAAVDYLPFSDSAAIVNFTIEHHVVPDPTARPRAALRSVSAGYFEVLSIPALAGRPFISTDDAAGSSVAVVNDAFVRQYLRAETVLGRRLKRGAAGSTAPWLTIVGVVGAVRGAGLNLDPQPEVFVPYAKGGSSSIVSLIVKSSVPARTLAPLVVERIHAIDPSLSPASIVEMSELVGLASGQPFFYARLFGVLAGAALLLSLAGVYGIAVLGVSARSSEIAIRSCLGAQPGDIVRLILRETATAVCPAVSIGALGAWILQKRMAAFVYGVGSTDWTVIAASALVLSVLAIGAVYLAIRRVVQVRPMELLKRGSGALA